MSGTVQLMASALMSFQVLADPLPVPHAEAAARIERLGGVVIYRQNQARTTHVGIGKGWAGGNESLALLGRLDNLTTLDLSQSDVSDAGLIHVGALTTLQRLELRNTPISDAGLVNLIRLKNLTFLDLSGTTVTDKGLQHLRGLSDLRILRVDGTSATDNGIGMLGLPELRTMYLYDRQVLDDGTPKWYTKRYWGNVFVGNPPIVELSGPRGRDFFAQEFPYTQKYSWSRFAVDPESLKASPEIAKLPRARIKSLSVSHLIVEIVRLVDDSQRRKKKSSLWRCTARYRLPRDQQIDAIFDATAFEEEFGFTYRDVAYGMSKSDVVRILGDASFMYQHALASLTSLYYSEHQLLVFLDSGGVYHLQRTSPPWWAKEENQAEHDQP